MDIMDKQARSRLMGRIRGKDTKPELLLRRDVWKLGLRYRVHPGVCGRPDIVFSREKLAVFVDGCFWHRCPQHCTLPQTRGTFWRIKLNRNSARDRSVTRRLAKDGWQVMRIWEHEVKADSPRVARRILASVLRLRKRRGYRPRGYGQAD